MNQISTEILFEKFEVLSCLKKDSHTSVYLANHVYLGKKIILKTLDTSDLPDKSILERFKREAKILAQLDHPNLIKVLDFGMYSHFFYISFEYFESKNLREIIKTNNISAEEKTQLIIQLLKALNIAHYNQVIHRDIKPENILVNSGNELKIADFGLALIQNDHVLTQKSSIVGTPSYMSPEQIRGESLTPQSDLFSAGIVFYELYTTKNPLLGKDITETINKILNFDESKLQDLDSIPETSRNVVKSFLKKTVSTRAKTAAEGLAMLGVNATIYDLPKEAVQERKNKAWYLIFPIVLIAALAVWMYQAQIFNKDLPQVVANTPDSLSTGINDTISSDIQSKNLVAENLLNKEAANTEQVSLLPALLKIDVDPWAEVYVDDQHYGQTPLRQNIELRSGYHTIRLENNMYPAYTRRINLKPGVTENLRISFPNLVGFLELKVEPWGKVYIDNVYKGESGQLTEPIKLLPKRYTIRVENPSFGVQEKRIKISEQQTTIFELNFKSLR